MRNKRCLTMLIVTFLWLIACAPVVCAADNFSAEDFLCWNSSNMGWSQIRRSNTSEIFNLTADEEIGISAMACVGQDFYAVDFDNRLFKLDPQTFSRMYIGTELEGDFAHLHDGYHYRLVIRDMDFDVANQRMLVLGAAMLYDSDYGYWEELSSGCSLYVLDLSTGTMTSIYTFIEHKSIYSMAVDAGGEIYFYSVQNDHIYRLNPETGLITSVASLENLRLYGEYGYDVRHPMCYDQRTGKLYLSLSTARGQHQIVVIDPVTGTLNASARDLNRFSALAIPFALPNAPTLTVSNVPETGKPRLTWNSVNGAVSYKVYRSTAKDGTYSLAYTASGTSYTNIKAESGTAYYYKVVAVAEKSAANSAASAIVSRTCDLPQPKLTGKVTSGGNPKLTWEKIDGAVSYKVYRTTSASGTYKLMKTLTNTSYTNTSHVDGKTYHYYIVAVADKTAANSAKSNVVKLTAK